MAVEKALTAIIYRSKQKCAIILKATRKIVSSRLCRSYTNRHTHTCIQLCRYIRKLSTSAIVVLLLQTTSVVCVTLGVLLYCNSKPTKTIVKWYRQFLTSLFALRVVCMQVGSPVSCTSDCSSGIVVLIVTNIEECICSRCADRRRELHTSRLLCEKSCSNQKGRNKKKKTLNYKTLLQLKYYMRTSPRRRRSGSDCVYIYMYGTVRTRLGVKHRKIMAYK